MSDKKPILTEGTNCWRIAQARRVAFLVDGSAYFEAFASAVKRARKTIFIAGWDVDSRLELVRNEKGRKPGLRLRDFLNAAAARTPELHVYILCWDYPPLFALEREAFPLFRWQWSSHARVHFQMDYQHPLGASHHQKFVVIDDAVAFCGGLDLTKNRWDTPEHRRADPSRTDPDGKIYGPYHDVQMAVDGEAAAALGGLFRHRWLRATGQTIACGPLDGESPWPEAVEVEINDSPVGVARTFPAYKDQAEVREVERLYQTAVEAADRSIYMENQYLTSASMTQALACSLERPRGPEIVLVLPEKSSGWLEQSTMDALRMRSLKHLKRADRYDRLRVYYPVSHGQPVYVHAKVMVVDDRLVRVGSSNLSNRSMAFDSECDLAVEAAGGLSARGVANFRSRLLAEHLDRTVNTVASRLAHTDSLVKTIESLTGSQRTLRPLALEQEPPVDGVSLVHDPFLLDPEKPAAWDRMLDPFTQDEANASSKLHLIKPLLILTALMGLAAAWRWTPLSEWISIEHMTAWTRTIASHPLAPLLVIGIYALGGIVLFPVTLLVVTTAIVFPPPAASAYALGGCLASALVCYGIGARLGKKSVSRLHGGRLQRLNRWLSRPGMLSVAIARNLPVIPFSVLNYIAGAWKIRLKDYMLGTAVGMAPGVLAITVFTDRLLQAVCDPQWGNVAVVAGIAAAVALALAWVKRRLFAFSGADR